MILFFTHDEAVNMSLQTPHPAAKPKCPHHCDGLCAKVQMQKYHAGRHHLRDAVATATPTNILYVHGNLLLA